MPFGKQPEIALAADRVYIGTADRYEITAFNFSGKVIATVRMVAPPVATTTKDIASAKERELALAGENWRYAIERDYAAMPFPKTVPAYAALRVDSRGNLWVQDYPRTTSRDVLWRVFRSNGSAAATIVLPTHLDVFEIGDDYVLGRFLDPDESVPEVRLYRLNRHGQSD